MAEASPAGARRRIIVLRHGETLDNAAGIWQGQRDTPLSEQGLTQARVAAPSLQMLAPDLLVSSDLARAAVTAEIVGEACGLPVRLDPRLREINVGRWSGMTTAQVRAQDGATLEALSRGEDVRRGGSGETVAELAERVGAALASILQMLSDGGTALVVCHGVAGRACVAALLGLDQLGAVALLRGLGNAHWSVVAEVSGPEGLGSPGSPDRPLGTWALESWNVGALPR